MTVTANLVVGADGSTRMGGNSRGLSTSADRAFFLQERKSRNCIIIGGRTAEGADYEESPAPIIVLSHSLPPLLERNAQALWWNCSPTEAIERAGKDFGKEIGIEAGPKLLISFLQSRVVDVLDMSVTPIYGGEGHVDAQYLFTFFDHVEQSEIDDTIFYHCTKTQASLLTH